MSITGVLDRSWRSPTDWSRINLRNNGKDHPDQAKDASCSGSTKSLADQKQKPMEFKVGDRVMLKVSPWKGVVDTGLLEHIRTYEKYVGGLPDMIHGSVVASKPKTMQDAVEIATELMDKKIRTFAERYTESKRKFEGTSRNTQNQQQQQNKRQNTGRAYATGTGEKKPYGGSKPLCSKCNYHYDDPCAPKCHKCNKVGHFTRDCRSTASANNANNQKGIGSSQKPTCYECGVQGYFKRECPKLKNNNNRGNQVGGGNAPAKVYAVGHVGTNPDSNIVTGTFLLNNHYASILFDTGADRSFVSTAFSSQIDITPNALDHYYDVELADGRIIRLNTILRGCTLNILNHPFNIDLMPIELGSFDAIIGMDWLVKYQAIIVCAEKIIRIPWGNETLIVHGDGSNRGNEARLHIISYTKTQEYMLKGCPVFLANVTTKETEDKSEKKRLEDVPIVRDFPDVFPEDLPDKQLNNMEKELERGNFPDSLLRMVFHFKCLSKKSVDEGFRMPKRGSDIGIQEKKAKLFNEWEMFTSTDGESIESYYHCFSKLMNDFKRNKYFVEKIASNLKFLNNFQPEWSRHVTINVGNQNGLIVVPGIANQNLNGNGNVVTARAEGNANDGSVKVQHNDNCYNNYIFNMFTQEKQHTELLEPIPEPHQVPQNDSNVISEVSSVEQGGGTVEQHPATVEETRAYFESLYNNLAIEVEKVNTVNRKLRETNADLTIELARYKNQEKCFEISQGKIGQLDRCYQKSCLSRSMFLLKKINSLHLSFGKQITTLNEEISNLNNQLSKEKSTVSSLQEEKKKLKSDFKIREDELLDKQIQLENKIKELDNILSLYNGKVLLEKYDPPAVYDLEETLQLAQESRFLRALHPKWRAKVTQIESSKELNVQLSLDELIGNLKVHEMIIKKDSEIVKAKVERPRVKPWRYEDFKKVFREGGGFVSTTSGTTRNSKESVMTRTVQSVENALDGSDPNHLIGECPKPPKDKNQRAFVEGSWSDSGEEDDEKVKNETCLVAQASSEICSESSYFSDENSSIDEFAFR
ncbi:putative reverse transcriptase domain-containing protein [Tanacetum coccineum]|uniref:Reverse transcriptase domain-containing protein n=1 Tax=Tanacetum coccineum TaxID=301880 RepID=A0ABQ5EPZ0_9ASTR